VTFTTATVLGTTTYVRDLAIGGSVGDGLDTRLPDSFYLSDYGVVPIDGQGADPGQWPWIAEIIHRPGCVDDVSMSLQFHLRATGGIVAAALLNYRVVGDGVDKRLSGYQVLWNGGGRTVTVSRLTGGKEHSFDYFDRWPGRMSEPNPVDYGPYKGWDYLMADWANRIDSATSQYIWPAGGRADSSGAWVMDSTIAARYDYDPTTGNVTLFWELRREDGTDDTPGVWDRQRTFTDEDALPPGGDFGVWTANYRKYNDPITNPAVGIQVARIQLDCDG
jgi:hypothetical protein